MTRMMSGRDMECSESVVGDRLSVLSRPRGADASRGWLRTHDREPITGNSRGRAGHIEFYFCKIKAVTIPNMPWSLSAWGRMWQWKAQVPGLLQLTTTSHRSPGAMLRVSHFHGAGTGQPSLAMTV